MKKFPRSTFFSLGIALLLFLLGGCSTSTNQANDRIPVTTSSDQARADYMKGMELANKLRPTDAMQYFNKAVSEDSNFAIAYLALAQTQQTTTDFLQDLNKAISLAKNASQAESLMIMGTHDQLNQNTSKVKDDYEKLVSLFPNDPQALNLLGNFYFTQQQEDEAISEFTKATQVDSSYSPSYNSLGYAYLRQGKYDDAEKAFKKYIELIPDEPNPYDSYAELLMKEGKFDESVQNYQKALSKDPNFTTSATGIAANYMYEGKYDDARNQLQKLFDSSSNENDKENASTAIAITYVDQWKPEMAIKQLDDLQAMHEKNGDQFDVAGDLSNKGDILFEMGKYNDAMQNYQKAHDIIMNSSAPQGIKDIVERGLLYDKARIAAMKKDFKAADANAQKFMQEVIATNNMNQINGAHQLMGMIDIQQKKPDDALSELAQANQQDPYTSYLMAKAYLVKGNKSKAKELGETVMNFNTRPTFNSAFARAKSREMLKRL
jgi:tetratricopeptide (TPR) repeat protein